MLNFRMVTAVLNTAIGTLQSYTLFNTFGAHHEFGNVPVRLTPKGFKVNTELSSNWSYASGKRNFAFIQASASPTLVDHVSSPSDNDTSDSKKKSSEHSSFLFKFHISW